MYMLYMSADADLNQARKNHERVLTENGGRCLYGSARLI
jgi:hypothetical protein